MKRILELVIEPNCRKKKEFSQTLNNLAATLQNSCSSMQINEAEEGSTINIIVTWETVAEMHQTLKGDEMGILSGAIAALCETCIIRLDGKLVGNQISMLNSMRIKADKH